MPPYMYMKPTMETAEWHSTPSEWREHINLFKNQKEDLSHKMLHGSYLFEHFHTSSLPAARWLHLIIIYWFTTIIAVKYISPVMLSGLQKAIVGHFNIYYFVWICISAIWNTFFTLSYVIYYKYIFTSWSVAT